MRERMESEWTLSWLAHWMLCGNGWSLSGRYHGWPIGCYAGTDGVSVDVIMVGPLDAMRERMESGWTISWLANRMLCGNGAWKLKMKKGKDKVRILKKKKAGSGSEAVQ
ncbi:unnamed protein product, partial [Symbiodinium sp. CCMP2592]